MMRILHVVRQFEPSVGGLEAYVKSMATHMKARGHECHVLTLNTVFADQTALPSEKEIDGIPVHRVRFVGKRRFFVPLVSLGFLRSFDVIHVHNTDGFFDTFALLARWIGKPMFATTHGGFFHTPFARGLKAVYFKTVTRLACRAYQAIFATSENDLATFKAITDRLILQPNAVEPLGDVTLNGKDFVYLGRLAAHKHVECLIETFAAYVKRTDSAACLHIIGPEWDVKRADLRALSARLGVGDAVVIHGFLSSSRLMEVLEDCGFFVSASAFEGFGMSMIEAMSVGLIPLVQPNASFQVLQEQGHVGALIDFANPATAAEAMDKAVRAVKPAHRGVARVFASRFSWEALVAATLAVYAKEGV